MSFPEPRPSAIEFPFAAARTVLSRIEELLDVLERISVAHDDVFVLQPFSFAGLSRRSYEQRLGGLITDLATERGALQAQHDEVSDLIARATALRERRAAEIAAWEQRRDRWNAQRSASPARPH